MASKIKNTHVNTTNTKRLMNFIKEIQKNPSEYYEAIPSNEITIWYIKIKNLSEEYTDGVYYMKIHFTNEYPFKAPDYYMLTPSGRFDINKKICFSNSGYHSESWSPLWGINQIIMGTISFFYERNSIGIGHITFTTEAQRIEFANNSKAYNNKYLTIIDNMFQNIIAKSEDLTEQKLKNISEQKLENISEQKLENISEQKLENISEQKLEIISEQI
jgi:ubiquitin-protein ligase